MAAVEDKVILHPGEFYFGEEPALLQTLLGTCIAITLWHPKRRLGGMCHFVLPTRHFQTTAQSQSLLQAQLQSQYQQPTHPAGTEFNGRYADQAIAWFYREITRRQTLPKEYQVKLFGASKIAVTASGKPATVVARENTKMAHDQLRRHSFHVCEDHTGKSGHQRILFDTATGDVSHLN